MLVQRYQDSCLVARDTLGFSSRLGRAIGMPLEVRWEIQCLFPVATGISGFLSIFQRSQASSTFEALNSTCLLSCERDMRPPVEMRRGISWVSTGDSDTPSSCEMKDEAAFKSLQRNPALLQVMASQGAFHFMPQIQGPSHIPIAARSLLLRCLRKAGILEWNPGNHLSS